MAEESKSATATTPKKSPIAAAQEARRNKPAGKREEVQSKDAFVSTYKDALKKHLNVETSNHKAWMFFKLAVNTCFNMARNQPVSLSGIGRFSLLESQRSVKLGKPAKRMRFKASQRVIRMLNDGTDFLSDMSIDEIAESKPKAEAKKPAVKKTETKTTETATKPATEPAAAATASKDLI